MASMTMPTSFLGGGSATTAVPKIPTTIRRGVFMVKATKHDEIVMNKGEERSINNGRRELVFAVAAAAACSMAKIAMADVPEPKRGTAQAKEKYKAVCVTMPTARICRN